jgi:hypothetical protein
MRFGHIGVSYYTSEHSRTEKREELNHITNYFISSMGWKRNRVCLWGKLMLQGTVPVLRVNTSKVK